MLQSDTLNPAMLIHAFCKTDSREMTVENFVVSKQLVTEKLKASGAEKLSINRIVFTKEEILFCCTFYSREENWQQFKTELENWNSEVSSKEPNYFREIPEEFKFSWKKVAVIMAVILPVIIYRELEKPKKESPQQAEIDKMLDKIERSASMNEATYTLDSLIFMPETK